MIGMEEACPIAAKAHYAEARDDTHNPEISDIKSRAVLIGELW